MGKIGVWLAGAKGAIATTLLVGASALARGLTKPLGLVTELSEFASLGLVSLDRLVFGGWDIISTSSVERARELAYADRVLPGDLVESVRGELEAFDGRICSGFIANGVPSLSSSGLDHKESLSATVKRLERDLEHFRNEHNLQNVIVVNLTPTEPPLPIAPEHKQLDAFKKLIAENRYSQLTPSILYAYIALDQGLPFVNFTPSVSVTLPALLELAELREVPFCGSDGVLPPDLTDLLLHPVLGPQRVIPVDRASDTRSRKLAHGALGVYTRSYFTARGVRPGDCLCVSRSQAGRGGTGTTRVGLASLALRQNCRRLYGNTGAGRHERHSAQQARAGVDLGIRVLVFDPWLRSHHVAGTVLDQQPVRRLLLHGRVSHRSHNARPDDGLLAQEDGLGGDHRP